MRKNIWRRCGHYKLVHTCLRRLVNGKDELPIPQKVQLDAGYMQRRSLLFDLKILWVTALNEYVGKRRGGTLKKNTDHPEGSGLRAQGSGGYTQ